MKIKHILFGLGLGLVCSGCVLLAFRGQGKTEMSDEEIMKRAEQLGMVENRQDAILTSELEGLQKNEQDETLDQTSSEDEKKKTITENENASSKVTVKDNSKKETNQKKKKNAETDTNQTKDNSQKTVKKKNRKTEDDITENKEENITVNITSGMTAGNICKLLQEHGVIEDAEDFRAYLVQKRIQYQLRAGTFQFAEQSDYDEIVGKIYQE